MRVSFCSIQPSEGHLFFSEFENHSTFAAASRDTSRGISGALAGGEMVLTRLPYLGLTFVWIVGLSLFIGNAAVVAESSSSALPVDFNRGI